MLFDRARKFAWVKMTWEMQSAVHSPQSTTRLTRAWDKLIILKRSRHQQLATAGMDICTPLVSLAAVFLFFFFFFFLFLSLEPTVSVAAAGETDISVIIDIYISQNRDIDAYVVMY